MASFDLPRASRELRFTGSLRALVVGKEKAPSTERSVTERRDQAPAPAPASVRAPAPSARPPAPPSMRSPVADRLAAAIAAPKVLVTMRRPTPVDPVAPTQLDFEPVLPPAKELTDDDVHTLLADKKEMFALPASPVLGTAQSSASSPWSHAKPAPRMEAGTPVAQPRRRSRREGPLPLWVWLFAACLCGVLGYRVAPKAFDRVQAGLAVLDQAAQE